MSNVLGPWQKRHETDGGNSEVRFADPHDGRTWSLDGSPRWIVVLDSCCSGEQRHYIWSLSDRQDGAISNGSRKVLDDARADANAACAAAGWKV